ncbi:MAG: BREX-1 system adenine-specific DNA-methyltransferase PglX [Chromatiaceae bacterium]|nr:BREX-1 system adenine-specific DNA-methyltransferase PglX [Chromatiaceae bacterium]
MDKDTRNRIQRATQAARGLLEQDFDDQLAGVFDIRLDGTIAGEPGSHLDAAQRIVRTKLVAAVEHFRASGQGAAEAVASYRREAAFTTLNRFVALKMLEARGLVQECISRGEQSSGFKEFRGLAPGLVQLPDRGYRLYIESLFDELSVQIRVLFNRRDASSLLWPKRATSEALLAGLNAPELADVWRDDETIGWIYQYYNDEAERKRMREESSAPRNSRELAVRNQFFTPRYVVEFLTDNTLGRLWYEMTRGQTRLKEQCRYLVRRPTEIFLEPGASAPEVAVGSEAKASDTLSQEELLRQPVHIPHRPLKDPREIRLLDPACGSMHFGLYAFDLYEGIYAEAWDIAQGPDDRAKVADIFAPFVRFAAAFADQAAFVREVPRLIVEHNLHGIDIDRRAVQIAGLSLWLRAQRAWHQGGVKPADRPRVTRSNVVCAEPMPGEKELLREFIEQQFPLGERPAFTFLLEKVFDRMALAGEAGSLLRIEEEIRGAIAEACALAQRLAAPRQFQLSLGDERPEQTELNLPGLSDEQFWQSAEQRIYGALKAYAEQAEDSSGFRRRLFADDAAQGFAFIDLCRKRYDLVVMNPPFGDPSKVSRTYLESSYEFLSNDMSVCFVQRSSGWLRENGKIGILSPRNPLFLESFAGYRRKFLLNTLHLSHVADLGFGVLDNAMIEVSAAILKKPLDGGQITHDIHVFRLLNSSNREDELRETLNSFSGPYVYSVSANALSRIQGNPFCYWLTRRLLEILASSRLLKDVADLKWGLFTADDPRFLRLWWEVIPGDDWYTYFKGGAFARYVYVSDLLVDWRFEGRAIKENRDSQGHSRSRLPNPEFYFRKGLTFPNVTFKGLAVRALPADSIFSLKGPGIFPKSESQLYGLMAFLNSRVAELFVAAQSPTRRWDLAQIGRIPVPEIPQSTLEDLERNAKAAAKAEIPKWRLSETTRYFLSLGVRPSGSQALAETFRAYAECDRTQRELTESLLRETEIIAEKLYNLNEEDRGCVKRFTGDSRTEVAQDGEEEADEGNGIQKADRFVAVSVSYAVGTIFGRWDIRYATGERQLPELPDPFAPLPVCPPGMLQGDDGLPLSPEAGRRLRAEGLYPLDVAWDGILVDDPEHPLDIERRVHDALVVICGDQTDAIQQEACELLGVPTLRDWFRRPAGFFADHLKRYSKSRRQAPIYWPLSSLGGRYSLWLYYHRFSKDSLYRALELVQEKVNYEERKLLRLTADAGGNPGGAERATLADQESLVTELRTLQAELARVAPLWNPNLNDGVILNYGPLWRMIGHTPWQKAVKEKWEELVAGKYDWAHLAMHLWPERVVPKCAQDRSLAIAHGLEAVFWEEGDKGKWVARTVAHAEVERLIAERISAAVKDALKSLLDAPAPVTGRGGGRKSSGRAPVRRAPTAPRSDNAGPGSRPATGSVAPDPAMLDAVKQAIAAAQGAISKSEVLAATGLTDAQWNIAINAWLAEGTITKTGAARGTRYHLSAAD